MKPIKFITTFSKNGYAVYGKEWINSFCENVKEHNITADLYLDFNIQTQNNKIKVINYEQAIPDHKTWIEQFNSNYSGMLYNKKMAIRFSYKSFVMMHALEHNKDCYIIWLDGDCVFKPSNNYSEICEILQNKFMAVQREHNGGNDHCESGFVLFDADHPDKNKFLESFTDRYKIKNIINMSSPYDGFIIYQSLQNIDYIDLNDGFGVGGIQSDPSCTFLNPILKDRFIHNIGITGKSSYESWNLYYNKDEYFKLLNTKIKKTPEEINMIRKKLLGLRNR